MQTVDIAVFRSLYEALPDAVIIAGEDGLVLSLNKAASSLFGVQPEELVGRPVASLAPSDAASAETMVFQKADGTVFRAATHIVAVPDNDGSLSATFLIIRPAPEPTQDRALEGGASRAIEDALDVITEGVAVYDRDDRLVLCNTAFRRLFGTVGHRLQPGMRLTDIVRDLAAGDAVGPAPIGSSEDDTWVAEQVERFRKADGIPQIVPYANGRWMQQETTRTPDGHTISIRVDVTDLKQQQMRIIEQSDELERKNAALNQFTSSVAHDLKAPLRHVSKFAEMIADDIAAGDLSEIGEYTSQLQRSTRRMMQLIDSLLDYARIADRILQSQTVQVRDVIEDVLVNLQADIDDCGARIEIGPLPDVVGDPELLARLFQNIISNAIKYRRPAVAPVITIAGQRDDGVVRFIFTDNGIGIEPQYADKIFEIFQRLHRNEAVYPGTGVGLSLAKRIADSHRGVIALDPSYRDGARFVVTMPA